jgi:hypothetical protein
VTVENFWSDPRLLFIEDQLPFPASLRERLVARGIRATMDVKAPTDWTKPFGGCDLPTGNEWDSYDAALVDLDLSGKPTLDPNDDLAGGSLFLPAIRDHAPWLPVICCSGYYSKRPGFILDAGLYPFDGHLPKQLETELTGPRWFEVLEAVSLNAQVRTVGESYRKSKKSPPEIRGSDSLKQSDLDPIGAGEAIRLLFHFAEWVAVERVPEGFSGAKTFRAVVGMPAKTGGRQGSWLVKLSRSPSTLQREIAAHLLMQRSGSGMLRTVPTVWDNVVCAHRIGAIAYQFATGTINGHEFIMANGLDKFLDVVVPVLKEFYGPHNTRVASLSETVIEVRPSGSDLDKQLLQLADSEVRQRLQELASDRSDVIGLRTIQFTHSLLHGDLNIRNIMLGERTVFIDFANSSPGPVASDVAGLVSHILLYVPAARNHVRIFAAPLRLEVPFAKTLMSSLLSEAGDQTLYHELLILYLASALRWDLDPSTREWILETLRV